MRSDVHSLENHEGFRSRIETEFVQDCQNLYHVILNWKLSRSPCCLQHSLNLYDVALLSPLVTVSLALDMVNRSTCILFSLLSLGCNSI